MTKRKLRDAEGYDDVGPTKRQREEEDSRLRNGILKVCPSSFFSCKSRKNQEGLPLYLFQMLEERSAKKPGTTI